MQQSIISVQFNNQSLFATLIDNVPYVAMKPICENIGLDWSAQVQKIKRHPILSKGMVMITTPSKGGLQEMLMLPLKMLNGWLFGVDSTRVKPEIKDVVIKYQEECFDVLANHFMPKQQPASTVISAKERMILKDAVNKYCYSAKESQQAVYWRLFRAYGVDKVELLPAGKLDEMLVFLGLRKPELHELVLVNVAELERLRTLPNPAISGELVDDETYVIRTKSKKIYTAEEYLDIVADVHKDNPSAPYVLLKKEPLLALKKVLAEIV